MLLRREPKVQCLQRYGSKISAIEQQCMLEKLVRTQCSTLLEQKAESMQFERSVPPRVEQRIGKIFTKARNYQDSVRFLLGTDNIKATVQSFVDSPLLRHVVICSKVQVPPSCCQYSQSGDGFHCYHSAAVLSEKYGAMNIWKFIAVRHLTSTWKEQYFNISCTVPAQHKVDSVIMAARTLVDSGLGYWGSKGNRSAPWSTVWELRKTVERLVQEWPQT